MQRLEYEDKRIAGLVLFHVVPVEDLSSEVALLQIEERNVTL